MFGEPYEVIVEQEAGGHGGGDPRLLDDLFGEVKEEDPWNRASNSRRWYPVDLDRNCSKPLYCFRKSSGD